MAGRMRATDYAGLAEALGALAYPARLELLDKLRFPHALSEIRVAAHRTARAGARPAEAASKQAVWQHLARLEEEDLVRVQEVREGGKVVRRYAVNAPQLYALTEEFRRLSVMHAGRGPGADATGTLDDAPREEPPKGPRVTIVHGMYEGKAFPLDAQAHPGGRWVLGRRRDVAVSLDYDPFVSQENAAVEASGGAFTLHDIPGSKNGTWLNWRRLPRGGARPLEAGDVVGVGRSLLVFAAR